MTSKELQDVMDDLEKLAERDRGRLVGSGATQRGGAKAFLRWYQKQTKEVSR